MMSIIEVKVTGKGAEVSSGYVTYKETVDFIKSKIKSKSLKLYNYTDDGDECHFYNYTNITNAHGIFFTDDETMNVSARLLDENQDPVEELAEMSGEDVNSSIRIDSPEIFKDDTDENRKGLFFSGCSEEEGMEVDFHLDITKFGISADDFDISNIYFGVIELDELFPYEWAVINKCFYLTPETIEQIGKEFYESSYVEGDVDLVEIYDTDEGFREKLEKFALELVNVNSGENIMQYIQIATLDDDVIYSVEGDDLYE
jgi:hypothetical protein